MPRSSTIKKSWETKCELGTQRHSREYCVTYLDDSVERAEAVQFFREGLSPSMNLPESIDELSADEAQRYLDEHPLEEKWSMLTLDERCAFEDDDLFRLGFLPELERLHSHAPHLTDRGVRCIRRIPDLQHLLIYSPLVTDACLEELASLKSLRTLDLQGSHLISRDAFDRLVGKLPRLVASYPPFERPLSEILAAAQKRAEGAG